jgi:hypothetical protein
MNPVLEAQHGNLRVLIWPVDPDAAFRRPCALLENYAGFLLPDRGESQGDALGLPDSFTSLEWQGQQYLEEVTGPLEWVRFAPGGVLEKGVRRAAISKPQNELCGWTVRPLLTRLHSRITNEAAPLPGSPNYDLRPRLPAGEVVDWKGVQGESWESLLPATHPLWGGIRHREAPANRTVKAATEKPWLKDAAIAVEFDFDGVAWGHEGDPALRFEWGGNYSFLLRGLGARARPVVERRAAGPSGKLDWRPWRTLDDAAPLDAKFWSSRHVVLIYRLAGWLVVEIDGTAVWIGDVKDGGFKPVQWKAAPLRLSVVGVDVSLRLAELDCSRPAGFKREASVSSAPSFPQNLIVRGTRVLRKGAGALQTRAAMHGTNLEKTKIVADWINAGGEGRVDYEATLQGTKSSPPLLCSFAAQFPPTAPSEPLPPVDIRPALESVSVETGDAETLPSAEARMQISIAMLERHVPGWQSAVLPFRPVLIQSDEQKTGQWKDEFFGYLLPDGAAASGFNDASISCIARDPKLKVREPAALVDGRFAPLDLHLDDDGGDIYGCQCAQKLLGLELGPEVVTTFNGNGDPFRYLQPGHYPLQSSSGVDYFTATEVPSQGGFRLPPPFGEDIEKWIKRLEGFDHAVCFHDVAEGPDNGSDDLGSSRMRGAFIYGHVEMLFAARDAIYELHSSTAGANMGDSLNVWPLLSRMSAQGLLESAFTRVQVWGVASEADAQFVPSLFVGSYKPRNDLSSLDPLSEVQSWPRTFLLRQEFIGRSTALQDYADALAFSIWSEFGGRAPERWEFTLEDQILPARWGEKLLFADKELRVVHVRKSWTFGVGSKRSTSITARSLSARGL